ncbi:FtsX-like permease family protein [Eggerthellaceae bacterium zg-887]|uniref:ABC transporter permease n=1 Tax=Xiamenia xianingshaonis TaxID=2682776 RepID=UPI00140D166F|nr:ABC transporter permease [Xiamenia xianingshaonis]NHM16205.1 FtsX-like permease family protein [Xiamenia xianingshaonis]
MNATTRFTVRSLAHNRVRTLVTVAGVALATALFAAVLACVSSLQAFLLESEVADVGSWTAYAWTDTLEKSVEATEADDAVVDCLRMTDVGFAELPPDKARWLGPYMTVKSVDGDWSLCSIEAVSGRRPESADEIMLPTRLQGEDLFGSSDVQVGSELSLALGSRELVAVDGDAESTQFVVGEGAATVVRETAVGDLLGSNMPWHNDETDDSGLAERLVDVAPPHTYTVVGFFNAGSVTNGVGGASSALTVDGAAQGLTCTFVETEGLSTAEDIRRNVQDAFGTTDVSLHDAYLRYTGITSDRAVWDTVRGFAAVLAAVIVIACVSLISNAFAISVAERTRQFGLLASVGASKRQLRRAVLQEAGIITLAGVPIGAAVGLAGTAVVLAALGPALGEIIGGAPSSTAGVPVAFRLVVNGQDLLVAGALTALAVLASAWVPSRRACAVNPVEAVRGARDVRSTRRKDAGPATAKRLWKGGLARRVFGMPGKLAAINAKRGRGKGAAASVSLAMAVVLLMTAGSIGAYLRLMTGLMVATSAQDVSIRSTVEDARTNWDGLDDAYRQMADVEGVAGVGWGAGAACVLAVPGDMAGSGLVERAATGGSHAVPFAGPDDVSASGTVLLIPDEAFLEWAATQGIDGEACSEAADDGRFACAALRSGYFNDGQSYNVVEYFSHAGAIDALVAGDYPQGRVDGFSGATDGFRGFCCQNDSDEDFSINRFAPNTATVDVVGLADEEPACLSNAYAPADVVLVAPASAMDALPAGAMATVATFSAGFDAEDHETACEALAQKGRSALEAVSGPEAAEMLYASDNAAVEEDERMLATVVNVFCLLFAGILLLIALASVFNTVTNGLILRRREFAVMRSAGLGPKGFRTMIVAECVGYGLRGLVPGVAASVAVSFLLYLSLSKSVVGLAFTLPWDYLALSVALVALIMAASAAYGMRRCRADSIVEALAVD